MRFALNIELIELKDTLRDKCDSSEECLVNCCISPVIAPLYFVVFVLMAQFVLVNVVIAVLMKHLEESHKQMDEDEDYEIDLEIAKEIEAEKKALKDAIDRQKRERELKIRRPLVKMASLPNNFIFSSEYNDREYTQNGLDIHVISPQMSDKKTNELIKPILRIDRKESQNKELVRSLKDIRIDNIECPLNVLKSNQDIYKTSPKIRIEADFERPPTKGEVCSPELLASKTVCRKFSDFMDEESTALTNCLQPSYPEFSKDSDQQSLDSVTWSADGDSNSSKESNK